MARGGGRGGGGGGGGAANNVLSFLNLLSVNERESFRETLGQLLGGSMDVGALNRLLAGLISRLGKPTVVVGLTALKGLGPTVMQSIAGRYAPRLAMAGSDVLEGVFEGIIMGVARNHTAIQKMTDAEKEAEIVKAADERLPAKLQMTSVVPTEVKGFLAALTFKITSPRDKITFGLDGTELTRVMHELESDAKLMEQAIKDEGMHSPGAVQALVHNKDGAALRTTVKLYLSAKAPKPVPTPKEVMAKIKLEARKIVDPGAVRQLEAKTSLSSIGVNRRASAMERALDAAPKSPGIFWWPMCVFLVLVGMFFIGLYVSSSSSSGKALANIHGVSHG